MITIKDKSYVAIYSYKGNLSGKQDGENCLVVAGENQGTIMFVKAGVPLTDFKVSMDGVFMGVSLSLYAAGQKLSIVSESIVTEEYTFTDGYKFYCDAEVSLSD